MSKLSTLLLIPALASAVSGGSARDADSPVSIRLNEAPADAVLESFARVLKADLFLDTTGERTVTLDLERVAIATALDRVCEQLNCYWDLLPGDPPILRVESLLSLNLVQADLRQVLTLFAQILGVGIDIDPEIQAALTLRLDSVPWSDALDGLCKAAGCHWSLEIGTRRLRIERSDAEPASSDGATPEVELTGPQRSRPPLATLVLDAPSAVLRFDVPGSSESIVHRLELGWNRSTSRVASADRRYEVVTSWIGLAHRRDVLFPMLVDCRAGVVHPLGPVELPIEESWLHEDDGVVIRLLPETAEHTQPAAEGNGESCKGWDPTLLNVRIDGVFNASNVIDRPGQSLHLLLVPTAERSASDVEAAVVVVDRSPSGDHELALLWMSEGSEVEMKLGTVAPHVPWTTTLPLADGTSTTLEVETSAAGGL